MILTWQPGAITTYALPVIEIEMIIDKLSSLAQHASPDDAVKLNDLSANWNTVLSNYRFHNTDLTAMFSAEALQFSQAVNMFKAFQTGQLDAQDFASAVANTLDGLVDFPVITAIAYALNGAFTQFKQTCDQVLPYNVGDTLAGASEDTGGAGSYLKGVCSDFDPDAWQSFATMITGACNGMSADGSSNNPLSSTALFQEMCASETLTGDGVPGGLQTSNGPESLLGFLSDNKKLITFGANSPVQLSWTSTVSDSKTFNVEFESSRTLSADVLFKFGFDIFGVGIGTENDYGLKNIFTLSLGKSSEEDHESERTVSVSLGDNEVGDFFAVRITEDPVYGTPVFTTMGGASKCPGETGTSRRESNVRILEIRERCGTDKASPCNELTLVEGQYATFGAVIENLSPTQDEVYYTIKLANYFDDYLTSGGDGNYTCGSDGQMSGLMIQFQQTDLQRIPYNRLVEVLFSVTNSQKGATSMCNVFNNVAVQIVATCEMPTSNRYVYQYGVAYNETLQQTAIMYDPAHRIHASNSTATFSVTWPAARRRLSDAAAPGLPNADGSDLADAIAANVKLSLQSEIAEIMLKKSEENRLSLQSYIADIMLTKVEESRLSLQRDTDTIRGQMVAVMVVGVLALIIVVVLAAIALWMLYLRSCKVMYLA